MLLSTGERISCALCAMAINDLGHRAISLTGSQAGIVTDTSHTKARILDVRADRIREALSDDLIVLVAGFQGVSTSRDVTTLGRGGSDTTAVALAAAIGAEVCEIYTDVAGVFSADPRIVPDARKLPIVSFEEMLEMAASGAKVLQLRSVEYARTHGVRIHCRSSFDDGPGTVVVGEEDTMEHPLITAVTHSTDEARITLLGVPDRPGAAASIFTRAGRCRLQRRHDHPERAAAAKAGTRRSRSPSPPKICARPAGPRAGRRRPRCRPTRHRQPDRQGLDRRRRDAVAPGVAAKVFSTLAEEEINIEMISTSPIKISCVIRSAAVPAGRAGAARGVRARGLRGPARAVRAGGQVSAGLQSGGGRRDRRRRHHDAGPAARAGIPGRRDRAVRLRALGREADRRDDGARAERRRRSQRLRHRAVLRRVRPLPRVGAAVRRARSGGGRQLLLLADGARRATGGQPRSTPRRIAGHRGIIANPNCSAMQALVVLKPIHDAAGLERIVFSSYQSTSGTGTRAIDELQEQARAILDGSEPPAPQIYPHPIAFNVCPRSRPSRTATTTPPRSAR